MFQSIVPKSSEIMHSDWLKLVRWLATSNQNALFQSRVISLKYLYEIDFLHNKLLIFGVLATGSTKYFTATAHSNMIKIWGADNFKKHLSVTPGFDAHCQKILLKN